MTYRLPPTGLLLLLVFSLTPAEIIQQLDFETGQLENVYTEFQGPTALCDVVVTVSRAGTYAMKSHVEYGDRRAEIVGNPYTRGAYLGVNWYGFSLYVPEDFPNDSSFDIFAQFHDYHNGRPDWVKDGKAPSCFLLLPSGIVQFSMRFQNAPETVGREQFDLGPIRFGHWHDIVVHVKWSFQEDGFIKIWRDEELKVDYSGSTFYDFAEAKGPYFKMGNYKGTSFWKGTGPRELYIDEYRMGDSTSSYEKVDPATYGGPADRITGNNERNARSSAAHHQMSTTRPVAALQRTGNLSRSAQVIIVKQGSSLSSSTHDLRGRILMPESYLQTK